MENWGIIIRDRQKWSMKEKNKLEERDKFSIVNSRDVTGGTGASCAMTEESSHDPYVNRIQVLLKPAKDVTELMSLVVPSSNRTLLTLDKHSITKLLKVIFKALELVSRLPLI